LPDGPAPFRRKPGDGNAKAGWDGPSRLCGLEDRNRLFADELALRDDTDIGHDPAANVVAVAIADGLRDIDAQANATIAAAPRDLVMKFSGTNSPGIG
jgi:hypothetical protein